MSTRSSEPDADLYGRGIDERELIGLFAPQGDTAQKPFGVHVGTWHSLPALAAVGERLEHCVFEQSFGATEDQHRRTYSRYSAASLFIVVVDHRRSIAAGAARVILPSDVGFKTAHDLESQWGRSLAVAGTPPGDPPIDLATTWDLATLSVRREYRKGFVSQALHQAICSGSMYGNATWFISILDVAVFRLLQVQLRRMFTPFPGLPALPYEGSTSMPVWCDLERYKLKLQREAPILFETLFLGRHLEEVLSAPDWSQLRNVSVSLAGSTSAGFGPTER